ncbi:hypothetical protein FRAHR75_1090022 [Frankia sp. Hr75.2]|nr:hypothetical protein FRAHR75_1090022 [Frankia sp. Hr75.2]
MSYRRFYVVSWDSWHRELTASGRCGERVGGQNSATGVDLVF